MVLHGKAELQKVLISPVFAFLVQVDQAVPCLVHNRAWELQDAGLWYPWERLLAHCRVPAELAGVNWICDGDVVVLLAKIPAQPQPWREDSRRMDEVCLPDLLHQLAVARGRAAAACARPPLPCTMAHGGQQTAPRAPPISSTPQSTLRVQTTSLSILGGCWGPADR